MSDIVSLLSGAGLRPSQQRISILAHLRSVKTHPSVERVWRDLLPSMPTLSRTTVYTTLALLGKAGLAQPIPIDGEELRWDGDTSVHGHFLCGKCGGLWDFPVEALPPPALPEGFTPSRLQLYCLGTCPDCGR